MRDGINIAHEVIVRLIPPWPVLDVNLGSSKQSFWEYQTPSLVNLRSLGWTLQKDSFPVIGVYISNIASTACKDLSHLTCFNSDKKGHYTIKCPEPRTDKNTSKN